MRFALALFYVLLVVAALPAAPPFDYEADDRRFAEIRAKRERGEGLTAEEQRFAFMVTARQNQQNSVKRYADWSKANPPRDSVGLVPLGELGTGQYKGEMGGLYPGGARVMPAQHIDAGMALARQVVPLDAQGRPSADGTIVLLSIGMSNTTQEFQTFQVLAEGDDEINPKLTLVDGAQGGQTAHTTADPNANFWKVVAGRLKAAKVTPQQVQVVWLKQANAAPTEPFPIEVKKLQDDLLATVHNLHERFANLKMVYLSSRVHAGYAMGPLNPEPHAYETGFAVKWLIADQLVDKPELNFDAVKGPVRAPWLAWGPYLWANGLTPRADGLTYLRDDLGPDGTHPSKYGMEKVAKQLMAFLKSEPTARLWFLARP